jgi:hypothetical protein
MRSSPGAKLERMVKKEDSQARRRIHHIVQHPTKPGEE